MQQLLGELGSRELSEWMAYAQVEPFGVERENLHAGIVAATVANVNRAKGKKALQPSDFLLDFKQQAKSGGSEGDNMAAMMAMMAQLAAAQNAVAQEAGEVEHEDRQAAPPGDDSAPDDGSG